MRTVSLALAVALLASCSPPASQKDSTAPQTRAAPQGGTFALQVVVELVCEDPDGSGCADTFFTTDGSEPTAGSSRYSEPVALTASATLRFFSVDVAGNAEDPKTETYVVQTDTLALQATPPGGFYSQPQTVTLSCTGCTGMHFTTDGSAPTTASSAYAAPLTIASSTTLRFLGVSSSGATSAVRTEEYVIDTSAPTVSATPPGGVYGQALSVALACADPQGSGCDRIFFTTDGTAPTQASSVYAAPISVTADMTLGYMAVDRAGNESAPASAVYVVDVTPPVVAADPPGGGFQTPQLVALECFDNLAAGCAGIFYTTDGTTPTQASTRYTTPITVSAPMTLKFFGVDTPGNAGAVVTATYVIDGLPPSVAASPQGGVFRAAPTVTLTCADGTGSGCASIHYTTDGTTPTTGSTAYASPLTFAAETTLRFIAVDNLGNTSAGVTEVYVVDPNPPVVTASPLGGIFSTPQSVALWCDDGAGTGCVAVHYTVDGSTPTVASPSYTGPIVVGVTTTIRFFGEDLAGNVSSPGSATLVIDNEPPAVFASVGSGSYTQAQVVTLTCDDGAGSGCGAIRFTLDGTAPGPTSTAYAGPLTISANATLRFYAVDLAGNASTTETMQYVIDTVAATVSATPPGGLYASTQVVTLTCNDGSGTGCDAIYFTTDGTAPTLGSPVYSGPLTIGGDTVLRFFATDLVGHASTPVTESYIVDSAAPAVSALPIGGTYPTTQQVALACDDNGGSGCVAVYFTTDGTTPTTSSPVYSTPITVSATTTVKFFAVDQVGHASGVRTEAYVIDANAPVVSAAPVGGAYRVAQTVTLSCTDGLGSGCASIYFTTDGSTPTTASTPYSGPLTISASTTLRFLGRDSAGNFSGVVTEDYVIDAIPPVAVATPDGGVYRTALSVALSCTDTGGSGCLSIRYTTDGGFLGGGAPLYTGPLTLATNTTLTFRARDRAGNNQTPVTEVYVIDLVAPTTWISPDAGYFSTPKLVTLGCIDNDGGSGCVGTWYTLDGGPPSTASTPYAGPFTVSSTTDVRYFSRDLAGNREPNKLTTVLIDTVPPSIDVQPASGTYASPLTVTMSCADDGGSGCQRIRYSTDGGPLVPPAPIYTSPLYLTENTQLRADSRDRAGNLSTVATRSYVVDGTAPVTTATPAPGLYGLGLTVSLACSDLVGGSGCANTYYTTNGSVPTTTSPVYATPIPIGSTTTLRYFSVDAVGNRESVKSGIYTVDSIRPTVTSTTPDAGSFHVATTTPIRVYFSEAMSPASINASSLSLTPAVAGTVASSDNVATFTPYAALPYDTSFTLTVGTGARDLAGNALAASYSSPFKTRSPVVRLSGNTAPSHKPPSVAFNSAGVGVATWKTETGGGYKAYYSTWSGGAWAPPTLISSQPDLSARRGPEVASNGTTFMLVYYEQGKVYRRLGTVSAGTVAFAPPVQGCDGASDFRLVANGADYALACKAVPQFLGPVRLFGEVFVGGTWQSTELLGYTGQAFAAAGGGSSFLIAWEASGAIHSSTWAGGSWSSPYVTSVASIPSGNPSSLSVSGRGPDYLVTFTAGASLMARIGSGSTWGAETKLDNNGAAPATASIPTGYVVAYSYDGSNPAWPQGKYSIEWTATGGWSGYTMLRPAGGTVSAIASNGSRYAVSFIEGLYVTVLSGVGSTWSAAVSAAPLASSAPNGSTLAGKGSEFVLAYPQASSTDYQVLARPYTGTSLGAATNLALGLGQGSVASVEGKPTLVTSSAGAGAIVGWMQKDRGINYAVVATNTNGTWSAPLMVGLGVVGFDHSVAAGATGFAVVSTGVNGVIARVWNGSWGNLTQLETPATGVSVLAYPSIVAGPSDTYLASWRNHQGWVMTQFYQGGTWRSAVALTDIWVSGESTRLAQDGTSYVAAWTQLRKVNVARATLFAGNWMWGPSVVISAGMLDEGPLLASNGTGYVAAWQTGGYLHSSAFDTTWSADAIISNSSPGCTYSHPTLASAGGTYMLVYECQSKLWSQERTGTTWGAPVLVHADGQYPDLAASGSTYALSYWTPAGTCGAIYSGGTWQHSCELNEAGTTQYWPATAVVGASRWGVWLATDPNDNSIKRLYGSKFSGP